MRRREGDGIFGSAGQCKAEMAGGLMMDCGCR